MMGTAYPGALDDTSGDIPLTGANPDIYLGSTVDSVVDFTHPTHHEMLAGAAEALEAKVGIGASTPVRGYRLAATDTGTTTWGPRSPFDARDWGLVGNASTDDTDSILKAINFVTGADWNRRQRVGIAASSGTFTLTYDGQTTASIAYDANAATIQAALEALSNLAPGDLTVTTYGSAFLVTFAGTGDTSLTRREVLTATDAGLSGGTAHVSIEVIADGTGGDLWLPGAPVITDNLRVAFNDIRLITGRKSVGFGPTVGAADISYYDDVRWVGPDARDHGLIWGGTPGGEMVTFAPYGSQPISGVGFDGTLYAAAGDFATDAAGVGLHVRGAVFSDFSARTLEFSDAAVLLDAGASYDSTVLSRSPLNNQFHTISGRQWVNAGNLIRLDGNAPLVDGETRDDAYNNIFHNVFGMYRNGDGIVLGSADHNFFHHTTLIRCNISGSEGTAAGVRFKAQSFNGPPAMNVFWQLGSGRGGVVSEGTETNTYPAVRNYIWNYDTDPGGGSAPTEPTIGTDSTLYWWNRRGFPELMVTATLPAGPATYHRVWYSSRNQVFWYTGAQWLAEIVQQFQMPLLAPGSAVSATGLVGRMTMPYHPSSLTAIQQLIIPFFVASGATALDASNKWTLTWEARIVGATSWTSASTVIATQTIDSGNSGEVRVSTSNVSILPDSTTTQAILELRATKTGTPGDLYLSPPTVGLRQKAT